MDTKYTEEYFLKCQQLPDGSTTANEQEWLSAWAAFAQKQVQQGKIKLHDVQEYDPDTGQVPNAFIKELALKHRTLN